MTDAVLTKSPLDETVEKEMSAIQKQREIDTHTRMTEQEELAASQKAAYVTLCTLLDEVNEVFQEVIRKSTHISSWLSAEQWPVCFNPCSSSYRNSPVILKSKATTEPIVVGICVVRLEEPRLWALSWEAGSATRQHSPHNVINFSERVSAVNLEALTSIIEPLLSEVKMTISITRAFFRPKD